MEHYLDNSATTKVSEASAKKAYQIMTQTYGNPSSLHSKGIEAERELNLAKECVARALGATAEEIIFTSGGTEANNLALFGTAEARKRRGKKIITTTVEHSSIVESADRLEKEGYEIVRISPQADGVIHKEDIIASLDENVIMVSVMLVNNETGAIMPIQEIFSAVKRYNKDIICHTDAVQAFGKLSINAKKLSADLISVSGHKIHAPKGVGALYIKKGTRLIPRQYGGEQQKKIRMGTEPMPLIASMGVACTEFDLDSVYEKISQLNEYTKKLLLEIDGVELNSPQNALPFVLNISAGRVRSETMLHFLEEREIYVSSGSACAKGKPSHVLSAMGIDRKRADSALRISFSKHSTKEDAEALANAVKEGLATLAYR